MGIGTGWQKLCLEMSIAYFCSWCNSYDHVSLWVFSFMQKYIMHYGNLFFCADYKYQERSVAMAYGLVMIISTPCDP